MKRRSWSVRQRLLVLVVSLALPMNLLVVAALVQLADQARDAQLRNLQYTARAIASAADAQLMAFIGIGRALAASPAVLNDDFAAFRAEAERAFPDRGNQWLVVSDVDGQQLLNLLRPSGGPLPMRAGMASHRKAIESGKMVISDVFRGPVANAWLIALDFPVLRDGKPFRVVSVVLNTAIFRDLLASQHPPPNWLSGIADSRGNFIARLPDHAANVGQPASAGWRAVMDRNGIERFAALDGETVWNANEISSLSGWRVGIGVKQAELAAPVWTTVGVAVLISALVSLLSLLLALWLAKGIAGPVAELGAKAASLVAGRSETMDSTLPEVARAWQSLESAMAKRAEAERQGQLLIDELAHRVKNTLAVVQALAMQTLRTEPDPKAFAGAFGARLALLSRAHDLLTGNAWRGATLEAIVHTAVTPFHRSGEDTFRVSGPPVEVPANAAITLSLMLHELATNAAKYGSLREERGHVDVQWRFPDGDRSRVHLVWQEAGGPEVRAPDRKGLGSRLLETGAMQLSGRVDTKWSPAGIVVHLTFPVPPSSGQ